MSRPALVPDGGGGPAPGLSVVIPTRNRARWLDECLRSLVPQRTDASVEFIVVDNGSADATPEVLAGWAARDERCRALREERLGRSVALNAGMRVARGDVFLFTDDDVIVDPGWIDAYERLFREHPDAQLAGGAIYPIPKDLAWPAWFSERALVAVGSIEFAGERPLTEHENVWGANMAARRGLFERIGPWGEGLGVRGDDHPRNDRPEGNEDTELQIRQLASGGAVWFCPGAVIRHRADVPGPRGCVTRGFANGRNSVRRGRKPSAPQEPLGEPHSLATGIRLATATIRMLGWCALLRLATVRPVFERAWLAAWSAGWRLEGFLPRGARSPSDRRILAIVWPLTQLARRLAPARG